MTITNYSDFKFQNHPSIVEASRIIIAEGTQPHRIVLRKINDCEYVTHRESVVLDGDIWKHGSFYWGHYFNALSHSEEHKREALDKAYANYRERCNEM